ncbi:hypothetical protein DM860_008083 [Cuscuta australis]|uniref:Rieske domain-containing protein n=1 Tax=Cuscuta australis TaxID=267555 RepID=A0A328D7M0_9ASTE|nr:hypothetical protein DM860_008083 [Cuscuta australis]
MEGALRASAYPPFHFTLSSKGLPIIQFHKPHPQFSAKPFPQSPLRTTHSKNAGFTICTAKSTDISAEPEIPVDFVTEGQTQGERFDWYAEWYPLMPICDLDKRRPQGKRVLGIDLVLWWDRNMGEWKVMDDTCPHRLAPLSEGRIDQWGRLQCVYHGWCFDGSGDCKFIPQAPRDGPPVHTSKRACVAVYPNCVQNGILWFWPNTDPADREGGRPLQISITQLDVNGIKAVQAVGYNTFAPPCVYYGYYNLGANASSQSTSSPKATEEHKLKEVGPCNWHKSCYVPTKADAVVVAFRRWLNKFAGGQVDWRTKFSGVLPQSPPREQLMDRYWSHTVKCSSCNLAYKSLNALEVALQVISIAFIGIAAASKQGLMSAVARNSLIATSVLCFLASKWLSNFIYKIFCFHDYDHAFR